MKLLLALNLLVSQYSPGYQGGIPLLKIGHRFGTSHINLLVMILLISNDFNHSPNVRNIRKEIP